MESYYVLPILTYALEAVSLTNSMMREFSAVGIMFIDEMTNVRYEQMG